MLWSIDNCQNKVYSSSSSRVFWVDRWLSAGFSIKSRANVRLTFRNQGRVVLTLGNANPGLKVNWILNSPVYECFHCFCYLCSFRIFKLKTKVQNIYRKPHRKVTKLKSKFSLILGKLNRYLNNPDQELRFQAWTCLLSKFSSWSYYFIEDMFPNMWVHSTEWIIQQVDIGIEIHSTS